MMMIFGSKEITANNCYLFYYRRVKRIVPLYLFIIFFVVILLFLIFPNTFLSVNMESGFYAIIFYTNIAKTSEDNAYFIALDEADDLFTHTWSLGVEMQFYLLAPIIFFLLHLTCRIDSIATVLYLGLLGGASLIYHLMADSFNSFNNVFGRIWQFEVGIISYSLNVQLQDIYNNRSENELEKLLNNLENTDDTDEEDVCSISVHDRSPPSKTAALVLTSFGVILMVFMTFCPFTLPPTVIRIVTTLVSGFVVVFGNVIHEKNLLGNRMLVYLGDISYALYLIHWPVYVYVKFNYPGEYKMYCLGILVSLMVAIFITETFEKWYLTLNRASICGMMVLLYVLLITILFNREPIEAFVDHITGDDKIVVPRNGKLLGRENMTVDEAIQLNWAFDREEYKNLVMPNCYPKQEHDYCRFNSTKLTGKLNIFILGNSYAPNQGKVVYDTFGKFARNMSKYSNSYCEVLIEQRPKCTTSYNKYLQITAKVKPDILFMIARQFITERKIIGSVETDPLFLEALNSLQKYEQMVSKKIYILNAMPSIGSKHIRNLNDMLKRSTNKTFHISNEQLGVQQEYKVAQKRLKALVEHCTKCELYDFNSVLQNSDGLPQVFDSQTKLSYYTSGDHLTPAGLEVITPIYQKLSRKFEKLYKSWGYKL